MKDLSKIQSPRNKKVISNFIDTDARLSVPNIQNVTDEILKLNNGQFTQELTAQIQNVEKTVSAIYKMEIKEIEKVFLTSPVAKINWASQMVILDGSLPLGIGYWYMKQSVEMGRSSNVLKIQIETYAGKLNFYINVVDDKLRGENDNKTIG